jgi:hypothetical protein
MIVLLVEYPRKTIPHALLAYKVSIEKSAVILMDLPFCVVCFFYLAAFNILSLFSILCACCFNDNMFYFGQVYLLSWRVPVPEWA